MLTGIISSMTVLAISLTGCSGESKEGKKPQAIATDLDVQVSSPEPDTKSNTPKETAAVSENTEETPVSEESAPPAKKVIFDVSELTQPERMSNLHFYQVRNADMSDPNTYIISDLEGNGILYASLADKETAEDSFDLYFTPASDDLVEVHIQEKLRGDTGTELLLKLELLMDIEGNVLQTVNLESGDIYVLDNNYYEIQHRFSGFDESYNTYDIFDRDGNNIISCDTRDYRLGYLGEGMFYGFTFDSEGENPHINELFSAETRQWIHYDFPDEVSQDLGTEWSDFHDGISTNLTQNEVVILDMEGNYEVVPYPENVSGPSSVYHDWHGSGNLLTYLNNYEDEFYVFDAKTKSFNTLNVDYLDRIKTVYPVDNYIVAEMKGADGEDYFAVFNRELNELVPPTQGSPLALDARIEMYDNNIPVRASEEGRIVILLYDMEGNCVGRFDEVDQLGEPIYDKVNITNAIDVSDKLFTLYKEFLETAS